MLALAASALALAGCGEDEPAPEPTTTTVELPAVAPTTTSYIQSPCFNIPTEVLRLQNDHRLEQRGVAGPPDISRYRDRAIALRDRARDNGCPEPAGLNTFLR